MTFTRTKEDFTCEHCGLAVKGNGYTNHCPDCLWSKHVDNDPGDRASDCGGMMAPISIVSAAGGYTIIHECQACGEEKRNRIDPFDDIDAITKIMKEHSGT